MTDKYENLKSEMLKQQDLVGASAKTLSVEERADWAYGNAVIENDLVTEDMAFRAAVRHGK